MREVANSKLRRILAHNQTFNCTELEVGDMVLFYKATTKKSSPRWRGPAKVLAIDESGVTVYFQSQTFKVARFCVRRRVKESEVVDQDGRVFRSTADPWVDQWQTGLDGLQTTDTGKDLMDVEPIADKNDVPAVNGEQGSGGLASPRLIPVPDSPRTVVGEGLSPSQKVMEDPSASFDQKCVPTQVPMVGDSQYDHLSYDELHGLCKARGYCRKDAKTVLKTRLEAMDSVEKKCIVEQTDKMDTSCSVLGKRERTLSDPAVSALPT